MKFLLSLPEDYDSKESWPLLMFLHGSGERGDDLQRVKQHGPPKLIDQGQAFPFIVVSPQCPEGRWWEATELSALLDHVIEEHKVDVDRIYLTGLSMGGFGTWRLAFFQPQRFAAIVPICGGGETYWAERVASIPAWVFHGRRDKSVPPERSEAMVAEIRKEGGDPKLTIYPEAEHDSWTQTYANPELYQWLLSQHR